MFKINTLVISIVFYCTALPALVLRPDIDPQKYIEFAEDPMFAFVGKVILDDSNGSCTCFGLDERTFVTAGHCIALIRLKKPILQLDINKKSYQFAIIGAKIAPKQQGRFEDVGVIYLSYPISVVPMLKYEKRPLSSLHLADQKIFLAGYGYAGFANELPVYPTPVKLAGWTSFFDGAPHEGAVTRFQTRFEHHGQGVLNVGPAPGDSGAPLIVLNEEKQPVVVGIHRGIVPPQENEPKRELADGLAYLFEKGLEHDPGHPAVFGSNGFVDFYRGYLSVADHTYVGSVSNFLESERSVKKIMLKASSDAVVKWSAIRMGSQDHITNVAPSSTTKPAYFKIEVERLRTHMDMNVALDLLWLTHASSDVFVPTKYSLYALRTYLKEGTLNVEGELKTEGFVIDKGELKGFGRIMMERCAYPELLALERYPPGRVLSNLQGHLNLSDDAQIPNVLSLFGNYSHQKPATMSARVRQNGHSSVFSIHGKADLNGGTLNIFLSGFDQQSARIDDAQTHLSASGFEDGFFVYNTELVSLVNPRNLNSNTQARISPKIENRWTVLLADALFGTFDKVEFHGQVPQGHEIVVEYSSYSVEVVMRPL